jgi:uncharacterized membrane protein YebE (DUF533 family)
MSENKKGEVPKFEIPIEGSLGLLALGAVGYIAWKKKKEELKPKENNSTENTEKDGKATS